MKPGHTGIGRLYHALRFSRAGIAAAWKHEQAFRQEAVLCVILLPVALVFAQDAVQLILATGSLFLLLVVELLNSAIEAAIDRFGGERHELSGRAKDMASAAVLFSLLNVLVVWGILLYQWL